MSPYFWRTFRGRIFFFLFLSVALHALVFELAIKYQLMPLERPDLSETKNTNLLEVKLTTLEIPLSKLPPKPTVPVRGSKYEAAVNASQDKAVTLPVTDHPPATQAAPPVPTAEEWAFASNYTLKNSKGYRYYWGQQVRSMMGTAVEGPDQGSVRFQVEIAPDGTISKLETLWATSAVAEQLARKAIKNLPSLPPTPTGKPLIFERTIMFTPFASGGPPIYQDDCLPDPPAFGDPFAWDGKSPQVYAKPKPAETIDPKMLADCLKQLPQDSIEAIRAHDQRVMNQWGSSE
jgi:hypothetical protein